jgi:hypothetical protein
MNLKQIKEKNKIVLSLVYPEIWKMLEHNWIIELTQENILFLSLLRDKIINISNTINKYPAFSVNQWQYDLLYMNERQSLLTRVHEHIAKHDNWIEL